MYPAENQSSFWEVSLQKLCRYTQLHMLSSSETMVLVMIPPDDHQKKAKSAQLKFHSTCGYDLVSLYD